MEQELQSFLMGLHMRAIGGRINEMEVGAIPGKVGLGIKAAGKMISWTGKGL